MEGDCGAYLRSKGDAFRADGGWTPGAAFVVEGIVKILDSLGPARLLTQDDSGSTWRPTA